MPSQRWSVYLLHCRDGSLYAGATSDLSRRLAEHQAGRGARYTRSRLPVALAWSEPAAGRSAALRREAALKRLSRTEKLALCARKARGAVACAALETARPSSSRPGATSPRARPRAAVTTPPPGTPSRRPGRAVRGRSDGAGGRVAARRVDR